MGWIFSFEARTHFGWKNYEAMRNIAILGRLLQRRNLLKSKEYK
jgi:hypothetical protein